MKNRRDRRRPSRPPTFLATSPRPPPHPPVPTLFRFLCGRQLESKRQHGAVVTAVTLGRPVRRRRAAAAARGRVAGVGLPTTAGSHGLLVQSGRPRRGAPAPTGAAALPFPWRGGRAGAPYARLASVAVRLPRPRRRGPGPAAKAATETAAAPRLSQQPPLDRHCRHVECGAGERVAPRPLPRGGVAARRHRRPGPARPPRPARPLRPVGTRAAGRRFRGSCGGRGLQPRPLRGRARRRHCHPPLPPRAAVAARCVCV